MARAPLPLSLRVVAMAALVCLRAGAARAQDEAYKADVHVATEEPQKAIKGFRVAPGFKVDLFAAEPMLANPVAFDIDAKGKFYVVETFRLHAGVTDARQHMNWLNEDLASRTVADRVAMYRKFFTAEEFAAYGREHDRIRLIVDRDGDGKADHAEVFADGFKTPETGLGAGVLARKGDVYFTCIPDLWLLRDTDGDGKADVKKSLHNGYGVHVGFLGHDLHGLKLGPDGKLYFSIGDRGFNVRTFDGKTLAVIDTGSVLRCEPDGTELEVVATGLRNPQELAFNESGDLFTVDNNSDGGDKARLVEIVRGGDSGWRIGYQFIERPNSRGIWNSEKMWYPAWEGQAAFLLPPLANFSDGPSGLTYYPGTGLNASQKGRFYLSDFRGNASNSGVRSFRAKPKGASFELVDAEQFLWGLEATDCDFGPDGSLYVSDWVAGWNKTGKGRIWKVSDPATANDPAAAETKTLLGEGFDSRSVEGLVKLLAHADMRVRQEAQFALVAKARSGNKATSAHAEVVAALTREAREGRELPARVHSLWGLAQLVRRTGDRSRREMMEPIRPLLADSEGEIRSQAAKALAETIIWPATDFVPLLKDASPRVRFQAAMALSRLSRPAPAVNAVLEMLRTEDGSDPYLRHAAVMALAAASREEDVKLDAFANDDSARVRMAVLLAMRRLDADNMGRFLDDVDPKIVLEAARAIVESPGDGSDADYNRLIALAKRKDLSAPLWRRVLAACEGYGDEVGDPQALATIATRDDVPEAIRVEALNLLADWASPSHRHPITGLWRPSPKRSAAPAVAALAPALTELPQGMPDSVRRAAAAAAGKLGVAEAGPFLRSLVADASRPDESRVEALRALEALKDDQLESVILAAVKGASPAVRVEAVRVLAKRNPDAAIDIIRDLLDDGTTLEKQGALAALGAMTGPKADSLLARWLDRLTAGEVAADVRLDLVEAAEGRKSADLKAKLDRYDSTASKADPLSAYRDTLVGGDASRGGRIFREKAEVQCLRCHKFQGTGGEVGPELAGIGATKDRAYILESIALPNKQIAQGFETQLIAKTDGQVVAGIVKGEDAKEVRLMTAEAKLITVPKDQIEETTRGSSAMPEDVIKNLTKGELRDLIEFLATSKAEPEKSREE